MTMRRTNPADYRPATVAPAVDLSALLSGPVLIAVTGEPGHFVDLASVIEFDDTLATGRLLCVLPAPAFCEIDDDEQVLNPADGPHALVLTGKSRRLALAYVRALSQRATGLLEALVSPVEVAV